MSSVRVASIRRRAVAGTIDSIPATALGLGGALGAQSRLGRVTRAYMRPRRPDRPAHFPPPWSKLFDGPLPRTIIMRNWRTPGACIAGVRTVDARTGGPVRIRSAVARHAAVPASIYAVVWGFAPALNRAVEGTQRKGADADGPRRAESKEGRYLGCLMMLTLLAAVSFDWAFALSSPLNQDLAGRLAGTLVIVER